MLFHIAPSANEIIKLKNGDSFLRTGDSFRKLSADQLMALEYSKGIKSFESRIVEEAGLSDLDEALSMPLPTGTILCRAITSAS